MFFIIGSSSSSSSLSWCSERIKRRWSQDRFIQVNCLLATADVILVSLPLWTHTSSPLFSVSPPLTSSRSSSSSSSLHSSMFLYISWGEEEAMMCSGTDCLNCLKACQTTLKAPRKLIADKRSSSWSGVIHPHLVTVMWWCVTGGGEEPVNELTNHFKGWSVCGLQTPADRHQLIPERTGVC